MKALTVKLTKYEIVERVVKALELIEIAYPELVNTFEYQQLNKLNERGMCHGLPESKMFNKKQLVELAEELLEKVLENK